MRLESKYGGDKRFTLDERFAENTKETTVHSEDQTEADEKKRQFDALERVLGHAVPKEQLLEKKEARKRKKNSERVPLGTRYDPSNPQHERLARNVPKADKEPLTKKKEKKKDEKREPEQKEEKVKQTAHSKVLLDEEFAQQLREEEEEKQPTSLLTLLSEIPRAETDDDDEEEEQEEQVQDEETEPIQEPQLKVSFCMFAEVRKDLLVHLAEVATRHTNTNCTK